MKKIFLDIGAYNGDSIEKFRKKMSDDKDYEIHAFEANPALFHYFEDKDVIFHKEAVWIKDGKIDFFIGGNEVSSTLVETKVSGEVDYENPIKVSGIDIDKWIKENFSIEDKIIIKMDVEGAEFEIIPHMIEKGSMKYVNEIWVEIHANKVTKYLTSDEEKLIEDIKDSGTIYKKWH